MYSKDNQTQLELFFSNTRKYDEIRNEDSLAIFPELKELFDKYEKN